MKNFKIAGIFVFIMMIVLPVEVVGQNAAADRPEEQKSHHQDDHTKSGHHTESAHHHHEHTAMEAMAENHDYSLYHLRGEFTNHRKERMELDAFRGKALIVVMFYGNCAEVCPILVRDAWRLYSSVSESVRENVEVLAVTFDSENDSPESLKEYAQYEQLDIDGWHFATADRATVRELATVAGVRYRQRSDGMFDHSNLLTVLDPEGVIELRIEGLNRPVEEAARRIEQLIQGGIMP